MHCKSHIMLTLFLLTSQLGIAIPAAATSVEDLERAFADPPDASKPWVYWWWLNGAASKEGITRDFEEMRRKVEA